MKNELTELAKIIKEKGDGEYVGELQSYLKESFRQAGKIDEYYLELQDLLEIENLNTPLGFYEQVIVPQLSKVIDVLIGNVVTICDGYTKDLIESGMNKNEAEEASSYFIRKSFDNILEEMILKKEIMIQSAFQQYKETIK